MKKAQENLFYNLRGRKAFFSLMQNTETTHKKKVDKLNYERKIFNNAKAITSTVKKLNNSVSQKLL